MPKPVPRALQIAAALASVGVFPFQAWDHLAPPVLALLDAIK